MNVPFASCISCPIPSPKRITLLVLSSKLEAGVLNLDPLHRVGTPVASLPPRALSRRRLGSSLPFSNGLFDPCCHLGIYPRANLQGYAFGTGESLLRHRHPFFFTGAVDCPSPGAWCSPPHSHTQVHLSSVPLYAGLCPLWSLPSTNFLGLPRSSPTTPIPSCSCPFHIHGYLHAPNPPPWTSLFT